MTLEFLLRSVDVLKCIGNTDIPILGVYFDSRNIKKGDLFIAIKGLKSDGHAYIMQAINNGAKAVLFENASKICKFDNSISYIQVKNSNDALAIIASNFYNNPSKHIKLIGVTGTNGKTTIVNLLYQLCVSLTVKAGMISTIENRILDKKIASTHTTPDILQLNSLIREMVDNECEYCFMEVSSHAISQSRIKGLNFIGGVFTNISQDHLDYHKTFSEYFKTKQQFFNLLPESSFALSNKDDKNGLNMLLFTKAKKLTYSLKSLADYRCKILENQFEGMLLKINKIDVWVKLIGIFNAYNILSVYAIANQLGFTYEEVFKAISSFDTVQGRFQFVYGGDSGIIGVVDYAHTDDALKNVLITINSIKSDVNLITDLGCGGDRDAIKRPLMTRVACNFSMKVILTSDNPRSEDPKEIIEDMKKGLDTFQLNKIIEIVDRKQAIRTACQFANRRDIILVAVKGHEQYQEINGKKYPFDDLYELKKSLNINN